MKTPRTKKQAIWGDLALHDLVVVDTAPIIYLLDGDPRFGPRFAGLFEAADNDELQIAISTVTLAEVLVGPLKSGKDALAKRYERALMDFEVIPVSHEIAVTAARLRASTGLRLPDAILAATSLECGAQALVTHDRDFSRLEGIRVLDGGAR